MKIVKIEESQIEELLSLIHDMARFEKLDHEVTATKESLYETIFVKKVGYCDFLYVDDQVAGYLMYFYNVSSFTGCANLYVEDIYVKPEFRRQGLGKACFVHLAKKAVKEHVQRIDWICLDWNQRGLDFYQSLGADALSFWVLHRLDEKAIKELANE
jgi:hypothetical protein